MSLTGCVGKVGGTLSPESRARLFERTRELRKEGVAVAAAGRQAVAEQLTAVQSAIAELTAPSQALDQSQTLDQGPLAQLHLPAGGVAEGASVISLLAGANYSSFIHESGHFFLEVQADLAARIQARIDAGEKVSPGEQGIVDDMGTLLKWFDVVGDENLSALTRWSVMTLDEKRAHHEQFAVGFEKFAMEGQAPSLELQSMFSRFRSWLFAVYKELKNLNVELTDDVRQVMGRMLASDMAIEEAEAARGMLPMIKTWEDAQRLGWSKADYDRYHERARESTEQAVTELAARSLRDMKWASGALDRKLKALQAEADAERAEIRRQVTAEVYSMPVYRAWQFLTGKGEDVLPGTVPAGALDITAQTGKLRTEYLRQAYGSDENAIWRALSARRMTSDTVGMDPDLVAESILNDDGTPAFDSGDALVRALVDAMPPSEVVDARTDQRMLEEHGDLVDQQAVQRAAEAAIHNEVRGRFIATELAALQAANKPKGRRGESRLLAKAAREYAAKWIATLKVRDVRPGQFAAAETRSAKLAEKALGADKIEEAAMHKRNQLVNTYLAKAAADVLDEVKAARAYVKRFDKRSKSIDPAYLDQIEQLLEQHEFRQATLKKTDRRSSLAEWVAEQQAQGIAPDIPPALLANAAKKSYKDVAVEELRDLLDTVKQIEHLGRLKNRLLLARDQREVDAVVAELVAATIEHGGERRAVGRGEPDRLGDIFEGFLAEHRKLSSYVRQMDGNADEGPWYQHIGRQMNDRGTLEDTMIEQATKALQDLYAPLRSMRGGISGRKSKVFIPEVNASLNRGARIAVALNWGNDANRQRVMAGDGTTQWTEAQALAVIKTLTPAELEFVNGVWAFIDTYWQQIAEKQARVTGVAPEKVEAVPFVATAADGTEVPMRGGYYPLKYDVKLSERSRKQDAAQAAADMMRGAITRATTRRGHTQARLEHVDRAVRLDLDVITEHVNQVVHDLAWHEWLIDTNKILNRGEVATAIRDYYGPAVLSAIEETVAGIAAGNTQRQTTIGQGLLWMRGNITRATMGGSLTTAFLQPFGLTQSMVRIGPRWVLQGAARWAGDAAQMESSLAWIREQSEFMRVRAELAMNRELRDIRGTVAGKSQIARTLDSGLFWLMQKMQLIADVPTWLGQYEKSQAAGLDHAASVAMADRAVKESQGGGHVADLAGVQRNHPLLTQFYSYFNVTLQLAAESTVATEFKNPRAVAGWLGDMALLMVVPSILPALLMFAIKGGGGDDDGETWAARIAKWQLSYLLGLFVGARELSGALDGFDYAGPPVARPLVDLVKAGKQTAQGEVDDPLVLAYARLIGGVFGLPTVQAIRSYQGWTAWDAGQEGAGPQSVLFGPPPRK